MSDFSDDEDGPQGELRPRILTECISDDSIEEKSNGGDRPVPDMTTAGVGSYSLDPNDKEYWTKFRLLTKQAFLLDNVKLSQSNYPDAVKEVVIRSRLTIMEFNEGEDAPLEQCNEGETSDYSDAESTTSEHRSEFYHREEDYYDWHYNTSPSVPGITADEAIRTVRNAENNDGQCPAFRKGNEGKPDLYSYPGGRAKSELSPEEAVRKIDIFSVDYVTNDDITVNMRDLAGVSHTNEDEVMRVSMITADVSQGITNSLSNNSQGIQDCVCPEREKQHDLSAHMDFELCEKDPLRNMTGNCFGVCGLTHRLNRHVARLHLDLVQLWRCPIAWCTTWKGSPQDCLEHVRSRHDAPWVSKTASIEKYAPPVDCPSPVMDRFVTDRAFRHINGYALVQRGRHAANAALPRIQGRLRSRLRSLLPSPGGADTPPDDVYRVTPTSVRRPHRLSRPKRLFPDSVVRAPILTEQNPAEMIGETVIDCRPSLLPVSIPLSGLSPETISGARDCVSYLPSEETGQLIMNMDTSEISINRIVGFAWNDGGTDVEDELPTPASSPNQIVVPAIPPAGTDDPFAGARASIWSWQRLFVRCRCCHPW